MSRRRRWILAAVPLLAIVVGMFITFGRLPDSLPIDLGSRAFWDPHTESVLVLVPSTLEGWGESPSVVDRPLWRFVHGQWEQLSDCEGLGLSDRAAFDPQRRRLVCLSRGYPPSTAVWDGSSWTVKPPRTLSAFYLNMYVFYNAGKERIEVLDYEERKRYYFADDEWHVDTTVQMEPPPEDTYVRIESFDLELRRPVMVSRTSDYIQTWIFDPERSRFLFFFRVVRDEVAGSRSLIYECSNGKWSLIGSDLPQSRLAWTYGGEFLLDPLRGRILFIVEDVYEVFEIGAEGLTLLPSGNWTAYVRPYFYVYHSGYDGIFVYGEGSGQYGETWLAKYIEEEHRFEWQRLDSQR